MFGPVSGFLRFGVSMGFLLDGMDPRNSLSTNLSI